MEEELKILEEFIKYFEAEAISRKYSRNISITVGEDDIEALEHLILAYKKLEEEKKTNLEHIDFWHNSYNEAIDNLHRLEEENKELKWKKDIYVKSIKSHKAVLEDSIPKQKIKDILRIEDDDTDKILSLLETIVAEFNRLEDIEYRKVQVEYNIIFNKGVESVEKKIRDKIEELKKEKENYEKVYGDYKDDDYYFDINAFDSAIHTLEELLEERNK